MQRASLGNQEKKRLKIDGPISRQHRSFQREQWLLRLPKLPEGFSSQQPGTAFSSTKAREGGAKAVSGKKRRDYLAVRKSIEKRNEMSTFSKLCTHIKVFPKYYFGEALVM